jgi:hypothetical protein
MIYDSILATIAAPSSSCRHSPTNDNLLYVKVEAFNPSIERNLRQHRHRARDGVRGRGYPSVLMMVKTFSRER